MIIKCPHCNTDLTLRQLYEKWNSNSMRMLHKCEGTTKKGTPCQRWVLKVINNFEEWMRYNNTPLLCEYHKSKTRKDENTKVHIECLKCGNISKFSFAPTELTGGTVETQCPHCGFQQAGALGWPV